MKTQETTQRLLESLKELEALLDANLSIAEGDNDLLDAILSIAEGDNDLLDAILSIAEGDNNEDTRDNNKVLQQGKTKEEINRRNKIKQEEKYGRLLQAMFKSNKYKPTTYYRKVCKLKKRLDTLREQYGAGHITRADYRRDYEKALAELLEMGIAMNAILYLTLPARNLTQDEKDALITSGLVVQRVYNGKTYLDNNLFHCGLGNDD